MDEKYGFGSYDELKRHFIFHYDDVANSPFATVEEYGEAAYKFMTAPASPDIRECVQRSTSKRMRFHTVTQEYISIAPSPRDVIITYFIKSRNRRDFQGNLDYFRKKCIE